MRTESVASLAFCGIGTSSSNATSRRRRSGAATRAAAQAIADALESRVLMSASLLKDINTTLADADPSDLTVSGGSLYFDANGGVAGQQGLWKTDGTTAGTVSLSNLLPAGSPEPSDLTDVNGTLYFYDSLGNTGRGGDATTYLFRSDGTAAGTYQIATAFDASNLINVNGTIYFFSYIQPDYGSQPGLFKTDGTTASTQLVTQVDGGSGTSFDGDLYFMSGNSLWKSDGTAAGTVQIESFVPPYVAGAEGQEVESAGGRLYIMDSGSIWSSDGTAAGTSLLKNSSGAIGSLAYFQGRVYFSAPDANQEMGIWKTDGTAAGTSLVSYVPSASTLIPAGPFAVFNNALYFEAYNPATNSNDLWRTDGTAQGTTDVNSILGPASIGFRSELAVYNGQLYFTASDGVRGRELWATDGTLAGTHQIAQINNTQNDAISFNPSSVSISVGDQTYFCAVQGSTDVLWKTDGTAADTVMVADVNGPITDMTDAGGTLYFSAGGELWKSDGSSAGTLKLSAGTIAAGSYPFDLTAVGNNVYFFGANHSAGGIALYRSDGTMQGTTQAAVVSPGYFGNEENEISMAAFDGTLFYSTLSASNTMQIDRIDPVTGAPDAVASFSGTNSIPSELTVVDNSLFFVADDGVHGPAIWRTDGSSLISTMIYSPLTEQQYTNFAATLFAWNGALYISNFENIGGIQRLDPVTSQATSLEYSGRDFVAAGNQLYFETGGGFYGSGYSYGSQLAVTDGTAAGTHLVSTNLFIPDLNGPQPMMADNGMLYFTASDAIHGTQLWQTDGTNTSLADPSETAAGWTPSTMLGTAKNGLVFAASDSPMGNEPWVLPLASNASANFVTSDSTTSGNWTGVYGADGYSIISQAVSLPSYVTMSTSTAQSYQWAIAGQADGRGLQSAPGSSLHEAGTLYAASSFSVDLDFTDGQTHQVAFYLLDYDRQGRVETVQVTNSESGQVLDSRTISNFAGGKYLVYTLGGDVKINFVNAGPLNAVMSAVFFDTPAAKATASLISPDSLTQGHWTGTYGTQGYDVIGGASSLPAYVDLSMNGEQFYTWAASTANPGALQSSPGSSNLVAACAYSNASSFTVNLDLTDGNTHLVSLYLLDYDHQNRAETIQISNAVTNAMLSTATFTNFSGGQYARWFMSGDLKITISNAGGLNEVLSGIFIDPNPFPASASFVKTDSTTQGTYTGVYGSAGYYVAGSSSAVQPTYASLDIPRNLQEYTWASNTTAINALQDSPGSSARVAGCIYSDFPSFNFNINITDGQTHQVALYLLDDDSQNRAETITITNYVTNQVLDTETVSNFTGGKYLVWNLSGDVGITITNSGGLNEVLSGVFFG